MPISSQTVLQEALQLPSAERANLVEELVMSLDQPDPNLDALWLKEAKDRIRTYKSGELDAVDAEEVFANLNIGR